MIYGIVRVVAIVAGAAGAIAAYYDRWLEAVGLGLLAIIGAGIALWKPPE
jgi:hypothetical protein